MFYAIFDGYVSDEEDKADDKKPNAAEDGEGECRFKIPTRSGGTGGRNANEDWW